MMLARFGVRTLMIATAVVVVVVFATLIGVASTREVRALVIDMSLERHQLLARQIAADYEQFLDLHRRAIETIASHAAAAERLDMASIHHVLHRTNASYPAFWGIGVTNAAGRIVAVDPPVRSDGTSAIGVDLSDRAWFKQMLTTRLPVVDGRIVTGRVKFTPTITVNVPVLDERGRFLGAVTGGLDLEQVRALAERLRIGATGYANVASADAVLFATGRSDVGDRDISKLPLWQQLAPPSGRLISYPDIRGAERLAGFATVPVVGWKVWVSQEIAEIEREVRASHGRLMGWLLLALAGTIGAVVFFGILLTRPIAAVEATAAAVTAGDLERRAPERGPREVASLARNFNRMADTVRDRIEAETADRLRLENVLREYGDLAARVAGGDLRARVEPAGQGGVAELGRNLNRMAEALERQLSALHQATDQLREESRALETVNRVSRLLSGELEVDTLVQSLTDAATQLTGAGFGALFYNVDDARGERYTLYALSGASREAFARFPTPRNTLLFGPTFRGEGVIRIDDVTRDARYGQNPPYRGRPPGHLPVVSYLAVPVVSRSGEVLGGLFFGHPDPGMFTERHERIAVALAAQAAVAMDNARLYEGEQRARGAAESANRTKDEFLATLSHELRTPLNGILGWTVMLRAGQLQGDAVARALAAIERSARAQSDLIEDLLDISRIMTGKVHLDLRPLDVAQAVEAAIDAVRPTAAARRVELVSDLASAPIVGDSRRVQQIAWNLLSNAIKFTPSGGRVSVRLTSTDETATLVVADTGQGITADLLPHVFDRFRQGDSTTTRHHPGLGLGLALVKHLVDRHGGTVTAESAGADRGATFTVRLPQAPAVVPATSAAGVATAAAAVDARILDGVRLLLVDDDPDSRDLFSRVLEIAGAEVQTASTVAGALESFVAARPAVLISDIAMPGEDGYALIGKIRGFPAREGGLIPAIALTAHSGSDDRLRALAAGFQMHLAKPVDPMALTLAVARLVDRAPS
jgi:signal transduction histidine kinase/ActR/RegA family two-component response regulator